MSRTRTAVLASSTALVLAGMGAALASGSGQRRAVPARPGPRSAGVAFAPRAVRPRGGLPGPAGGEDRGRPFLGLRAAAEYLQLPVATLAADLRSGKTLAQVAGSTAGKSASGLLDFLVANVKAALDEAVKAGRLTPAQEDSIVSGVRQRLAAVVNGTLPEPWLGPWRRPGPGFGLGLVGGLWPAADYLQLPVATLAGDLRSGKTLADVASSTPGKSASGLVDALVTQAKTDLDDAVKAGRLTPAQADAISADLRERITAFVNGTMPGPGMPFVPRFRFGPDHDRSGLPDHGVNA